MAQLKKKTAEDEIIDMILQKQDEEKASKPKLPKVPAKERSASMRRPSDYNTVTANRMKIKGSKDKAPPTTSITGEKSSVHGLNKYERAERDTYAEDALKQKKLGLKKRPASEIKEDPGTPARDVWNTIQLYDRDKSKNSQDGSAFYELPGEQAFQELGIPADEELVQFWDNSDPDNRYYIIRAMADDKLVTKPSEVESGIADELSQDDMEEDDKENVLRQMGIDLAEQEDDRR